MIAQADRDPKLDTETLVTPEARPAIGIGARLFAIAPQHTNAPPAATAHADSSPVESTDTPLASPVTCTGSMRLSVVEPFPRPPKLLVPQQSTLPPWVSAQAEMDPTETWVATLSNPVTGVGVKLDIPESLPS